MESVNTDGTLSVVAYSGALRPFLLSRSMHTKVINKRYSPYVKQEKKTKVAVSY